MQPVNGSKSSGVNKCTETSSKCVVWDGPDINCLGVQICAGQSVEVVIYNTAKTLCDLLDDLNISTVDLACLTPPPGVQLPQTVVELSELIIKKLCEIDQEVTDLQNTGSTPIFVPLPDCDAIVANCPAGVTTQYTDGNGNVVTSLLLIDATGQTSPAVEYLATLICDLLCRMSTAETEIQDLRDDVDNLMNQAAGALPSVNTGCIAGVLPLADPINQDSGAVYEIAQALCDVLGNITGDPSVGYPLSTTCTDPGNPAVDLATEPALGAYPGASITTLQDLGAIPNATLLKDVINNMLVAICDLRNFATIVKNTCCPSLCANILNIPWTPAVTISGIGAVIPGGAPPDRTNVQFFLNGTYTDAVTNLAVSANFANNWTDFSPPGIDSAGCTGAPPKWNLDFPVTITIQDVTGNIFTDSTYLLSDFITTPVRTFTVSPPLNASENYTISYTVSVQAPDCTTCTFTNSMVLSTTCDNQPIGAIDIVDEGANGFSLDLTGIPVPAPGTTLTGYNVTVTPLVPAGSALGPYFVPVGYTRYYFYPDVESYPGLDSVSDTDPNWFTTDEMDPNTQYEVCVVLVYDCGVSTPVCETFTTLVGIEILISGVTDGANVLAPNVGQLTLSPVGLLPGEKVSANFPLPIQFDGQSDVRRVVSCSPGIKIDYTFETLMLKGSQYSSGASTNCYITGNTRGWGQVAASYFTPGYTGNNYFTDPSPKSQFYSPSRLPILDHVAGLITEYNQMGCFDYITSAITATAGLGYSGPPLITNINDGTGQGLTNRVHGTYSYLYNSSTYYPTGAITAPASSSIGTFNIINSCHRLNNGNDPKIYIKIDDTAGGYIAGRRSMWYGVNGGAAGDPQSASCVEYIQAVLNNFISPAYTAKFLPGSGKNNAPVPLPIFMRIEHFKYDSSTGLYNAPTLPTSTNAAKDVYDVTFDWLAQLPTITTPTGFLLNNPSYAGIKFKLRDKLRITFTGGVANDGSNPNYPLSGAPVSNAVAVPSSVTIFQDPFNGIWPDQIAPQPALKTGPFSITGNSPLQVVSNFVSYTGATTGWSGYTAPPANTFYGVPLNNFLQNALSSTPTPSALGNNYWNPLEIVLSGDVTITWKVG